MPEFFAAFANNRHGVNGTANLAANLGKVGKDTLQVGLHRRQLGGEQLIGERIRRHAATPSLPLMPKVSVSWAIFVPDRASSIT